MFRERNIIFKYELTHGNPVEGEASGEWLLTHQACLITNVLRLLIAKNVAKCKWTAGFRILNVYFACTMLNYAAS